MEKHNEHIKINFKKVFTHTLFLLLIPIILSIYIRAHTINLTGLDNIVEQNVIQNVKNNIGTNIKAQYPFLPQNTVNEEINKQFEKINKTELKQYAKQQAQQYKTFLQDPNGNTYLLAIDPYHYYQMSKNYVNNGIMGEEKINGESINTLMRGRNKEAKAYFNIHSYITAQIYNITHLFNKNYTILQAAFITPIIIIALAIIPIFFIAKLIGGKLAGFITATLFAVHPTILTRTVAGFSDSDPYHALLPLMAILFFIIGIKKMKAWYICISAFFISLHFTVWGGWWYTFVFLITSLSIMFFFNWKKATQYIIILFSSVLIMNGLFSYLIGITIKAGLTETTNALFNLPLSFIKLKAVAETDIWPNVLTTVAELNPSNINNVLNGIGIFLFFLTVCGITYLIIKSIREKNKTLAITTTLLIVWIIAGTYASIKSMRFTAILFPAIALTIGIFTGLIYPQIKQKNKQIIGIGHKLTTTLFIILICMILIPPTITGNRIAQNELPSMNDEWYNTLTEIKNNSSNDAIITSWWDFGHWFKAIAERSVTFDGGDQGKRIYWVGKLLSTNSSHQSKSILRMLNCDQNNAYYKILEENKNVVQSVKLTNEIILLSKEKAKEHLQQQTPFNQTTINSILQSTHCEQTKEQYLILSSDMIGKAGVWSHFGTWDFERAQTYNNYKNKPQDNNIDPNTYFDIQKIPADQWITGWYGYEGNCIYNNQIIPDCKQIEKNNTTLICNKKLCDSLFTNLYFFKENIEGFELYIETQNIKVYKVKI